VSPATESSLPSIGLSRLGGKHAQVDRPLRRARLIIMRLSPPSVVSRSEPDWHDCSIHPLPSCACTIARIRQSGSDCQSGGRLASPASDKKNVHRAGRVSGGLLNPSGGARNRPRNKSVLAQSENELNHNFAGGNEFCLTHFQKSFARVKGSTSRGELFLKLNT